MAYKFKAGDIISLISGSHSMTVKGNASTRTINGNVPLPDRYECFWFDGKKSQKAVFKEEQMKLL